MNLLVFIIAYPILWIISKLPYRLFYLISDLLYVLLYHVIGYRKKAVRDNLSLTLPELSVERRKEIEKRFYRHLCDIFMEMAKAITIPEQEQKKRYLITNPEILRCATRQNRSVLFFCSHYANWEWMNILGRYTDYHGYAVYKQINNPYFDKLFKNTRSRFGATLIEMRETIRVIRANELLNNRDFYAFISDQSPMVHKSNYWTKFMGVEVPVFTGAEAIGKKFNMVPFFLKVSRVKRGYYTATLIPLHDVEENIKDIANYELTDRFLHEVEKQIREAPEYYFWTHKRWKHQGTKPDALA